MNATVDGQGLDMMVPMIPESNKADTKAGFRIQVLTAIKSTPTYEKMKTIIHQLARNARTVKVSLGGRGGKHGVLPLVIGDGEYLKETEKE